MKERPILFSGAMVRALLDGSKTQTRRVVKPQPPAETQSVLTYYHPDPREHFYGFDGDALMDWAKPCPYGEKGDHLYVRETWQHSNHPLGPYDEDCHVFYRADYLDDPHGADGEKSPEGKYRDWRPSIHMPRAASRILLEVTGVRVERLQEISETDACAEGARECDPVSGREVILAGASQRGSYVLHYRDIWDSLNAARGYGWQANPFVWVVEFKRVK